MNPYEAIIGMLRAHAVDFDEVEHEPVYTSEQAAKVRGFSLDAGAKSLLLKANSGFILVVLAGSKRLDSKKLKKSAGVKSFRFATPEEVKEKMGCEIGACYPFGSIAHLPTYLDSSLLSQLRISFNPGVHDKSITLKLSDYLMLESPRKIEVAA